MSKSVSDVMTLRHFKLLRAALDKVGAEANLNIKTFKVKVHFREVDFMLHPQFVILNQGRRQFSTNFSPEVVIV